MCGSNKIKKTKKIPKKEGKKDMEREKKEKTE